MKSLLISMFAILVLLGCSSSPGVTEKSTTSAVAPQAPTQAIDVSNAQPADCASGGKVYTVYLDGNGNGVFDPSSDQVLSRQAVCNGSDGYNSLVAASRVTVPTSTCVAGSGIQINTGVDSDRSGVLDPSEYLSSEILCDGATGSSGPIGPAGQDGSSFALTIVTAPLSVCPAGGSTLLMALDVDHLGSYSADEPEQQALTLCNGASAPATAYSPVEAIQPCGATVAYKEVLLRLANGQVLGSFSDDTSGTMTRLAFLSDGTYMDTDGSSCVFSLSTDSTSSTRSVSWSGSVQESWSLQ
jgi:hypothetical protein